MSCPARTTLRHNEDCAKRVNSPRHEDQVRREAWTQTQTMARIVAAKYRHLQLTLTFTTLSTLMYVAWLLLLPS